MGAIVLLPMVVYRLQSVEFHNSADMEWESASKTANFGDSGCGFVYPHEDAGDHHATFLMMDGKVQTYRAVNNNWTTLKGGNAGRFNTPKDKAHMTLVVDNQWITVM
jgi:hypothetical protein